MTTTTMRRRMQQSLRSRSSKAADEWQTKVQRLWSFRRQHWDGLNDGAPPSIISSSRSAPLWTPPHAKPPPKPSSASARSLSKPTTPFFKPSAWKRDIVPVPLGLATQTQSQLLIGLVSRGSETFLEQLHRPPKGFSNFELLKLGPRLSGFGSSRLLPAGQAAMEDSFKKEQLKHRANSMYAATVAFGRSNYASCLPRNNDKSCRKSAGQVQYNMAGATGAKREVINTIQEYHINAEARAQLTKRAGNVQSERRVSSARSLRRGSLLL